MKLLTLLVVLIVINIASSYINKLLKKDVTIIHIVIFSMVMTFMIYYYNRYVVSKEHSVRVL